MSKKLLWGAGITLLLLAAALLYLTAALSGSFSGRYYRAQGDRHRAAGRENQAEQAYLLALRAQPGDADSRLELARLQLRQGREEEAEALLQEGIRQAGESGRCWLELARLYVRQGTPAKASALLDNCREGYLGLSVGQKRPRIALSPAPGALYGPVTLRFEPEQGTVCYYTLDGSPPDLSSPVWPGSLRMEEGTYSLSMIAIREDLPSPVFRGSYTVREGASAAFAQSPEELTALLKAYEALLAARGQR